MSRLTWVGLPDPFVLPRSLRAVFQEAACTPLSLKPGRWLDHAALYHLSVQICTSLPYSCQDYHHNWCKPLERVRTR